MSPEHSPEHCGPLHLARCAVQLGAMAVREVLGRIQRAIDDDPWGDDPPEDQAIHSDVFNDAEGGDAAAI